MKLSHVLAAIPFLGFLVGVPFVNSVTPYVLGLPFLLFWMLLWVVITSGIMAIIYKLDPVNKEGETR